MTRSQSRTIKATRARQERERERERERGREREREREVGREGFLERES